MSRKAKCQFPDLPTLARAVAYTLDDDKPAPMTAMVGSEAIWTAGMDGDDLCAKLTDGELFRFKKIIDQGIDFVTLLDHRGYQIDLCFYPVNPQLKLTEVIKRINKV